MKKLKNCFLESKMSNFKISKKIIVVDIYTIWSPKRFLNSKIEKNNEALTNLCHTFKNVSSL